MSTRLIYLLTTLRTHHRFERDRDRIDARLAATRLAVPDPVHVFPIAA